MTIQVLLVEDRPFDIVLTMRAMAECTIAHQFTSAGDGAEALQLLSQRPFDLILLDLKMPRVDGFEFLQQIRSRTSDPSPVIVLSTSNLDSDKNRANDLGAVEYVNKAIDFQDFRSQLQLALARHGFC